MFISMVTREPATWQQNLAEGEDTHTAQNKLRDPKAGLRRKALEPHAHMGDRGGASPATQAMSTRVFWLGHV